MSDNERNTFASKLVGFFFGQRTEAKKDQKKAVKRSENDEKMVAMMSAVF